MLRAGNRRAAPLRTASRGITPVFPERVLSTSITWWRRSRRAWIDARSELAKGHPPLMYERFHLHRCKTNFHAFCRPGVRAIHRRLYTQE